MEIFDCFSFHKGVWKLHMQCMTSNSASNVSNSATPGTVACQGPLSMGILQARILKWVAMPSSRGPSQAGDQTQVSCIAGWFFPVWATREA